MNRIKRTIAVLAGAAALWLAYQQGRVDEFNDAYSDLGRTTITKLSKGEALEVSDLCRTVNFDGNKTDYTKEPVKTTEYFHETGRLSDRTPIGQLGAMSYILDSEGKPISNGFHEIKTHEKGYLARLGAGCYVLNPKGDVVAKTAGFPDPHPFPRIFSEK